jgi:hypothetical protein
MSYYRPENADLTTRTDDPDSIRRDIEATRTDLSRNVDALTDKVSPSQVMDRKVQRAKSRLGSVKERVMGASDDPYDQGVVGGVTDTMSTATSSAVDAATSAPAHAKRQTQGNPLAAGLIAFGVGWLVSSLIPSSEQEQQAATAAKDQAQRHSDTLTRPLKEAAGDAKDNLQGPAHEAVASVVGRAQQGADTVQGEARTAKDDIASSAQGSNGTTASGY